MHKTTQQERASRSGAPCLHNSTTCMTWNRCDIYPNWQNDKANERTYTNRPFIKNFERFQRYPAWETLQGFRSEYYGEPARPESLVDSLRTAHLRTENRLYTVAAHRHSMCFPRRRVRLGGWWTCDYHPKLRTGSRQNRPRKHWMAHG